MTTAVQDELIPAYFPEFVESLKKLSVKFQQEEDADLEVRFKAHPLMVLKEFGAPVEAIPKHVRGDLYDHLSKADLLGSAKCTWCKIGLESALVIVGGVAACAVAILLAPEVLV